MNTNEIIVAVASPPGRSARGIVRVSGTGTPELLRSCMTIDGATERMAAGVWPATFDLGSLDVRCLVLVFHAPRSYTGEDAAEIHVTGNPRLLERVADTLIATSGKHVPAVRHAEAGDFTARAYLSGRLDLIEAEGVAATIAARSDAELRAARQLSSGALGAFARALSDEIAGVLALVEAGIDFTDQEDVVPIGPGAVLARLESVSAQIRTHLAGAVGTEQLEAIPTVVLAGHANAGKSTLFNALLGRHRAVVSSVAGTTRDALVEPLEITTPRGPAEILLVDLAGAEDPRSILQRRMQSMATDAIARASLVLHCVAPGASDEPVPDGGRSHAAVVTVHTKSDLTPPFRDDKRAPGRPRPQPARAPLIVSAISGQGLDDVRRVITERLADQTVHVGAEATILRPRHEAALRFALEAIDAASTLVRPSRRDRALPDPELVASELRAALDALTSLAGRVSPDDVLGRIFATFCIGK